MPQSPPGPQATDVALAAIVSVSSLGTIDDVIAIMKQLDRGLPDDDGLKWFNLLYLRVTEEVKKQEADGGWQNPAWLSRLDVVFAKLYFDAVTAYTRDRDSVARAWRPLFDARYREGIARVQFALAGMNAHINHDLPMALVQTSQELGLALHDDGPEHSDYEKVNSILEMVEQRVKPLFDVGIIGEIDRKLGSVDDVIAMWKVRKARETAWENAEILQHLAGLPALTESFLLSLDRLVSLASQGLLVPIVTRAETA
jgi:hypothetical protein